MQWLQRGALLRLLLPAQGLGEAPPRVWPEPAGPRGCLGCRPAAPAARCCQPWPSGLRRAFPPQLTHSAWPTRCHRGPLTYAATNAMLHSPLSPGRGLCCCFERKPEPWSLCPGQPPSNPATSFRPLAQLRSCRTPHDLPTALAELHAQAVPGLLAPPVSPTLATLICFLSNEEASWVAHPCFQQEVLQVWFRW